MAKILFVQKKQMMQMENIAIMQISSVLKLHGHICELITLNSMDGNIINSIKKYAPDIIGFSTMTVESAWTLEVSERIKKSGITALILAGGPHPTFFQDFLKNDSIDAINIGEGEYSMLELANAMDNNLPVTSIKNIQIKKDGKIYKNGLRPLVNIDELPLMDRNLYLKYKSFRNQGVYYFVISRGCPYDCSFCFVHQWKDLYKDDPYKTRMRLKNIDESIAEIKKFSKQVKISLVSFVDSTFNLKKDWTIDFLKKYGRQVGIPFTINLRPNLVDEDIAKAIADTKCCQSVRMGIEVGNEKIRKNVLGKNISNKKIDETVSLFKKHKVKIVLFTMYGLPGERLEDAFETVELCSRIRPYSFSAQVFHPYPGLRITKKAILDGYLREDDLVKLSQNKFKYFNSILQQPEIDEVMNLMKLAIPGILFPFLIPLIKKMVHLRPNFIFDCIYSVSSFMLLKKYASGSFSSKP